MKKQAVIISIVREGSDVEIEIESKEGFEALDPECLIASLADLTKEAAGHCFSTKKSKEESIDISKDELKEEFKKKVIDEALNETKGKDDKTFKKIKKDLNRYVDSLDEIPSDFDKFMKGFIHFTIERMLS